jgi:DNA-binding NarL/FixJ family response regulator
MTHRTRVLVIEENRLARAGLAALLDAQPDLTVVAAVGRPDVGLLRAQETKPHVVLVNASLGSHSSNRFVERVRKVSPEPKVVVTEFPPVEEAMAEFAVAGASGFVPKRANHADLVGTVRSVAGGVEVVLPPLTSALFSCVARAAVARSAPAVTDAVRMSKREREVIDLIAAGLSNKEIARRLSLATNTVKSHVHNILEKLVLHNRLQIAAHAHRVAGANAVSP